MTNKTPTLSELHAFLIEIGVDPMETTLRDAMALWRSADPTDPMSRFNLYGEF